jgi:hypothetical protein
MVSRTPQEAMRQAMEEWKDFHNSECKRLATRLHAAVPRNVSPLQYIGGYEHEPWSRPDPAGLVSEMKRIINHPEFAIPTPGWTAALRHGDPRFLWETLILDANADYAPLWSDRERAVVARAIADTYERFAAEAGGGG